MANYCTNLFFASTENEQDLNMIEKYLDEHFETYLEVYEDTLDGEFTSRWTFPCESIDEMMKISRSLISYISEFLVMNFSASTYPFAPLVKVNGIFTTKSTQLCITKKKPAM